MPDLPSLQIVPVESLLIHEHHDHQRTQPLVLRIRSSGVLRNPPIVSPLQDGSGRYMVLDGANRVTAFSSMGFRHLLTQVVQPGDPGLTLQNWNHVVWEMNPERFLNAIRSIPNLELVSCTEDAEPDLEGDCGLALIKTCDSGSFSVCTEHNELVNRVALLNALVDSYKEKARLDRTNSRDVGLLGNIYPQLCGLVVFPSFQVHSLLRLTGEGFLLPPGVTRFLIAPRALHVNYPLDELAETGDLEEKNRRLQAWVQERVARKGVRYYAEPTFLFDE